MVSLPSDELDSAPRDRDATNPHAYGIERPRSPAWPLLRAIDTWLSDKRRNVSRPKLLFAVSFVDALVVTAAGILAAAMTGAGRTTLTWAMLIAVLVALSTIAVLRRNWSYTISSLRQTPGQVEKIVKSVLAVFCMGAGGAYIAGIELFSPATAVIWLALAIPVLIASRFAISRVIARWTRAGRLVRRTVIVGGGQEAEELIAALEREDIGQLQILGVFDDRNDDRSPDSVSGYAKLGNFEQLVAFCRNAGVDLLIAALPVTAEERLLEILERIFTLPIDVRISSLSSKLRLRTYAYTQIGHVPMLAVMNRPLTDWDRVIKNVEDRVLGTLLLVLAAPVMAVIALAIRLDSKGPILFKQRRFGFNNELIGIYKFRSMYADAVDRSASKLVTRDDPRVTRIGRFIRKTSLDELPQLINVVLGEMSLVGPRPHATQAKAKADLYQTVVDGYFARHRVKPGVTGWAQVTGWRGETDTHEKIARRVEADLHYIDNWSVLFDLYIIALTPIALLTQRNAY